MSNSFYSLEELKSLGIKKIGENVLISRKASLYNIEEMKIGNHVRIDDFCILSGKIVLNNYIHISAYSALYGKGGIELEDFTGLSPRCTIFSASDDFSGDYLIGPLISSIYTNVTEGAVLIKKFAQIGSGCIIMPGVIINEGTVVGAMSFVKRELDSWNIYAGNPLRFIKPRNKEILEVYNKFLKHE